MCHASGVWSIGRAPCSGTMWLIESQCVEVWPQTVNATTSYEYGGLVSPNFCTSSWLRCCHITVRWCPLKVGLSVAMSFVRSVAVQVRPRISTLACTDGAGHGTM